MIRQGAPLYGLVDQASNTPLTRLDEKTIIICSSQLVAGLSGHDLVLSSDTQTSCAKLEDFIISQSLFYVSIVSVNNNSINIICVISIITIFLNVKTVF